MSFSAFINSEACATIFIIGTLYWYFLFFRTPSNKSILDLGEFIQTTSLTIGMFYSVYILTELSRIEDLGPPLTYILMLGIYSTLIKLACLFSDQFRSHPDPRS